MCRCADVPARMTDKTRDVGTRCAGVAPAPHDGCGRRVRRRRARCFSTHRGLEWVTRTVYDDSN
jgi:hypothetical protein